MWDKLTSQLANAVGTYDRKTVERLCTELITLLGDSEAPPPEPEAKQMLGLLRRKRFFAPMCRVAEALMQAGLTSATIQRQYAQGMIECGNYGAALVLLEKVAAEADSSPFEVAEARGLIGRTLKQQYVNNPRKTPARTLTLQRAIAAYEQVYRQNPSGHLWHGINAVALVLRAQRDGVEPETQLGAHATARAILAVLDARSPEEVQAWDMATGAEACIALGKRDEALAWLKSYVEAPACDAFEIASTLRQLREVWGFQANAEGSDLLAVLEAALLKREGGAISVQSEEIRQRSAAGSTCRATFEKVFGAQGPVTFAWYEEGRARARSVGRVEDALGRGVGSGFLVRAADFFPWANHEELCFVTNAHVLSAHAPDALRPEHAQVRFEAWDPGQPLAVQTVLWESPVESLDVCIARLARVPPDVLPFSLAPDEEPEFVEGLERRFYALGYPLGGQLSISLHDNLQVGWRRPHLDYRTPTAPGSSGSAVCNEAWQLVALHQAGSKQMPRLDGHPGVYEANRGIWMREIARCSREVPRPLQPATAQATSGAPVAAITRDQVLISYSHKDKKHLAELQKFLKPFVRTDQLRKWDDGDIAPGADWFKAIRSAMDRCKVAVLLVSQDYLSSDFIQTEEFPKLLEDAARGDITVLWVAVSPSTYSATQLATLQAANTPERPLSRLDRAAREATWVDIAGKIRAAVQ